MLFGLVILVLSKLLKISVSLIIQCLI